MSEYLVRKAADGPLRCVACGYDLAEGERYLLIDFDTEYDGQVVCKPCVKAMLIEYMGIFCRG